MHSKKGNNFNPLNNSILIRDNEEKVQQEFLKNKKKHFDEKELQQPEKMDYHEI